MIQPAIVIALMVNAVWATFQKGHIFGKVQEWFSNLRPMYKKPLFDCTICMTPYYGSILYWIIFHESVSAWVITIVIAMGINTVVARFANF